MGSTAITGELIWPSQNDLYGANVGGAVGDGVMHYERQRRKLFGSVAGRNNYVISGGELPLLTVGLTITIPPGNAIIEGHFCEWPATNITLPASNTSHIFLKLVFSGTVITGLEIEDNTSASPPSASTKLGVAVTSTLSIVATDARILGPGAQIVLTSGSTFTWPAGIYRLYVQVYGASGGGGGGGEAGAAGAADGTAGGTGGNGGATNFGVLTADGGSGGGGGGGGGEAGWNGANGGKGTVGTVSGGALAFPGKGMPSPPGGVGGNGAFYTSGDGGKGGDGGEGGYVSGWMTGTPGSATSYAIGAAGTAGTAGIGVGGADGNTGTAGFAGRIVLNF